MLRPEGHARARFWRAVRDIDLAIIEQPGLVGHAKRMELFGDQAWTVSVWQDEASLLAFVQSTAHRRAMAEAGDSFIDARFARLKVSRSSLPLPWDEVLGEFDRSGRHYFE